MCVVRKGRDISEKRAHFVTEKWYQEPDSDTCRREKRREGKTLSHR